MPTVEIYSSEFCGYCARARRLLDSKGIEYTLYEVDGDGARRREMRERSGGYTVPQIFIDGRPIGGCDDLYALERSQALDSLLGLSR